MHTNKYARPQPGEVKNIISQESYSNSQEFPTWKTIEIGSSLKNGYEYQKCLEANGVVVAEGGQWGYNILRHPSFFVSDTKKTVELVLVSALDLGVNENFFSEHSCSITIRDLVELARSVGLKLCSFEAGPLARELYTDQPLRQRLRMIIDSVNSDGNYNIYCLANDNGNLIIGGCEQNIVRPDCYWALDVKWIFMK